MNKRIKFFFLFTTVLVLAALTNSFSGDPAGGNFLVQAAAVTVTRGPYLQMATSNAMTIRWRTSAATNSAVRYGTVSGQLNSKVTKSSSTTEHEIRITGLSSAKRYYYSVGTTTTTLAGGSAYFFYTPPTPGSTSAIRIWAIGDSGKANANMNAVRDAYSGYTGSTYTNVWLLLGDNAYGSGTDTEYQSALFNEFTTMLKQTPVWPTFGNHDAVSADSPTQTGPYYNIFTLPKNAEAGGLKSGTEAYYSFDYGNVHFICLDSQDSSRSPTGPMVTWLRNDIAATTRTWVIAFWHHPPYSKGNHDSDTEYRMIEMREKILPALEDGGVDLVLTGHSHDYERSFLLDGHYDYSYTLNSSMIKDGGSGRADSSDGAYEKPSGKVPHAGTVYTVAGNSSELATTGSLNHPAMFTSLRTYGSVIIDVNGNRLDAKCLDQNRNVRDHYTILKGSGGNGGSGSAPSAPGSLQAAGISKSQIRLTWSDNSGNEQGFQIERSQNHDSGYSQIATVGSNTTQYTDSGLPSYTVYYYRVRAYNSYGNSAYSNVDGGRTYQ
jgi:calcineurin-like phosphoesterase family protein/purple acid phosphatase-like protein/fibronectin type III domain protein